MNIKQWRTIHRWAGLFIIAFLLFYTFSGLLLNHRKFFNNFLKTTETHQEKKIDDPSFLHTFVSRCKTAIGNDREPAIIIIRDNVIDFRYDRHGSESVLLDPATRTITMVKKEGREPWHSMKWLHVVYQTGPNWVFISDFVAVTILIVSLSGLFCLRYRRPDIYVLLGGILFFLLGVLNGRPT